MLALAVACFGILMTIALTILAGYAVYLSGHLLLPVPIFAHVVAILLPVLTLVAHVFPELVQKIWPTTLGSSSRVAGILDLLNAALLTNASTLLAPEFLRCSLENRWLAWFRAKDAASIRGIQDALDCCGLWSMVDRAWPFPDREHRASACLDAFGRDRNCGEPLTDSMRLVLSIWIAIGAYGLIIKAVISMSRTARVQWALPYWSNRALPRQARVPQVEYRDDPSTGRGSETAAILEHDEEAEREELTQP